MENNFLEGFNRLDLNGPVLEHTTQPSDASGDKDASAHLQLRLKHYFQVILVLKMEEQLRSNGLRLVDLLLD